MSVHDQPLPPKEVSQPAFHSPALQHEAANLLSSPRGDFSPGPGAAHGQMADAGPAAAKGTTPADAAPKGHAQPAAKGAQEPLTQTENRIEAMLKKNPSMEGLANVYKELDQLRTKDGGPGEKFGKDLEAINKKLHADGLLPGLSIVQDKYTGADGKDHAGLSMIADNKSNPHNHVGSEVSNDHASAAQTAESSRIYHAIAQHHSHDGGGHGHGHHGRHHRRHHHFDPSRDSAESGRASHGGYDRDLTNKNIPKGERKDMIDAALKHAGIPQTPQYEAAMNKIITRESGWNTNAVNHTDINARRGDPSKGLMQVIHSTFESYRDKSLPNSQTDPMANMTAALNYMGARYGHGDRAAGLLRVAGRSGGY
ncbi:MAG: transglycosylase SLT domain-containing protein [Cyanobacteria bacterium REEB67]|nr:transglycosylase SLT domain-containing protein [Cyanobacteria bacterium REEB67]